MSELGDYLERFYSPDQTFHTVHACVRRTTKSAPKVSSSRRRSNIGRPRQDKKPRSESIENLEFWARLPDKVRVESTRQKDGRDESTTEIVNGHDEWKRFADGTVEKKSEQHEGTSERHRLPTEFQRHFDRGLLRECFAALTLETIGNCQVANRECLKVRAIKVPDAQLWPHWFSFEAIEFELAADVEKAVLLSIAGIVDGQPVDTHEVLEVTFDEEIDDSLFTYVVGADEVVQPATPVTERITLEAAAARAPFTVLDPKYIPDREQVHEHATYEPSRPGDRHESLTVFYMCDSTFESLWITQSQKPDNRQQEELEWDTIKSDGRKILISDPHPDEGCRVLVFERGGTHVSITSDLPRDEMARIALSMTPVSGPKESE